MRTHWKLVMAFCLALAQNLAHAQPACNDTSFVDTVDAQRWTHLRVQPEAGTAGIRSALQRARDEFAGTPVRIVLAPGYYADNIGAEIYVHRLQRSATDPVWLVAEDGRPDATVLGHGLNLLGVSYLALEGLTIGPATVGAWNGQRHADPQPLTAAAGIHVAGAALEARSSGLQAGALDTRVYGRFEPSHHVLVRRNTVQNLFDPAERDAETSDSQSLDGMKFNQVEDLWVLDNTVTQTTRHGVDNVGVHRAAFCRNVITRTGGGMGIEAKGGSTDILFDSNTFYRVRRVNLGGENTDATYYHSIDGRWDYEALRVVARNNLIVDAREAALEFSGCSDCSAVHNSILYSAEYQAPTDGGTVYGGDAIRVHDSQVLGADEGAGSDCVWWDANARDYVTVDPCWGVGARAPAPVGRILRSAHLTVADNLFASVNGSLGNAPTGSTRPCPLNVLGTAPEMRFAGNIWWNGPRALPTEGCSALPEDAYARMAGGADAAPSGIALSAVDGQTPARLNASALSALTPTDASRLLTGHRAGSAAAAYDRIGAPRSEGEAAGALVFNPSMASDRVFSWAQRQYPQLLAPAGTVSRTLAGYYLRHYVGTQAYLATRDSRVYYLGPASDSAILDLGPLTHWQDLAGADGY